MSVIVTFTLTDATAARFATAYGTELGLVDEQGEPRNATLAEFKAKIGGDAWQVVYNQEFKIQQDAIEVPPGTVT